MVSVVSVLMKSPAILPSSCFTMVSDTGFTEAALVTVTRLFWLPQ